MKTVKAIVLSRGSKNPFDDVCIPVVSGVSAVASTVSLLLASMLSWFFAVTSISTIAGVHPVASFPALGEIPALAGVPEIIGASAVATIPAVTDDQGHTVVDFPVNAVVKLLSCCCLNP
jgi:hypothetical protein